jgi:tetratricopeptide (TPR) repeat protein
VNDDDPVTSLTPRQSEEANLAFRSLLLSRKSGARGSVLQFALWIVTHLSYRMRLCARACIAIALLGSHSAFPASGPDYPGVEQQIQQGNLPSAEATLQEALTANDGDFQAHLLLGIVFQEEGRPVEALKQFDKARQLRPNDPAVYVDTGRVLASQGEFDRAAEQFADAIERDPGNATARSNWGIVLCHQQKWKQAITQLHESVSLQPRDLTSWSFLFQAYLANKDFASARVASTQIERLSPQTAQTYRTLGAFQGSAGDYADAVINLRKALQLEPDSIDTGYNLALALMREGRLDDARIELEKLKQTTDNGEVEDLLGEVYEAANRPLDAVRAWERAVALEPQNEEYCFSYLSELLRHKNYDAAVLVGDAAVRNIPNSVRLRLALVAALYGGGRVEDAHRTLLMASQDFPDSDLPLYLRSILVEGNAQSDSELAKDADRYLASHPQDPVALLIVGREKDRQGDPKAALLLLNRSLALGRESAETQLTTAKVYAELEDWPQVIAHAQRAVALSPDMREAWYRLARALDRAGKKSDGDAAMKHFLALNAQTHSPVSTFVYTLH